MSFEGVEDHCRRRCGRSRAEGSFGSPLAGVAQDSHPWSDARLCMSFGGCTKMVQVWGFSRVRWCAAGRRDRRKEKGRDPFDSPLGWRSGLAQGSRPWPDARLRNIVVTSHHLIAHKLANVNNYLRGNCSNGGQPPKSEAEPPAQAKQFGLS